MYKLISITFVLCSASFHAWSGDKHHVIIDGGMVHLRGGLVEAGCSVSTEDEQSIVNMGKLRTNQFKGAGSYTEPVTFKIKLTDCSTAISDKVGISVYGSTNDRDPQIFKLEQSEDAAKGVGIALFNHNGEIILPNNLPAKWIAFHEGESILSFNARYRATDMQVIGGKANASLWFNLTYE